MLVPSRKTRTIRRAAALATGVATFAGVFALIPAPAFAATGTVDSVQPTTAVNNNRNVTFTFTTSDSFFGNPQVTLSQANGADSYTVTASSTDPANNTVTATVDFQANGALAAPGGYNVEICTAVAGSCTTPDDVNNSSPLVVTAVGAPVVTDVSPSLRATDADPTLHLQVTHAAIGDKVTLVPVAGTPGTPTAPGFTVTQISTVQITGELTNLATATPATYDVVVTDAAGTPSTATSDDRITIVPAPTVTGVLPANTVGRGAGQNGSPPRQVTMSVANLPPTDAVDLSFPSGTGLSVALQSIAADATNPSLTDVVAAITANSSATGPQTLTLTDGTTGGTAAQDFKVDPAPAVKPISLGQNMTRQLVTFNTQAADSGARLEFPSSSGVTISGTPVVDTAAQTLKAVVSVAADAPTGKVPFSIVNGDAGRTGYTSSTSPVTVDPAPTLTSISPPSVMRGAVNQVVTLAGTHFADGMTARAVNSDGTTRNDVTFGTVTIPSGSSTRATVPVTASSTATRGPVLVQLQNPDLGTSAAVPALTIDSFGVSSISPTSASNDAASTANALTVVGANIPSGSTDLKLTPAFSVVGQDPILVTPTSISPTKWTGTANLVGMAPGDYQVQLVNGSDTGTCSCTFRINSAGAPTVTKATPAALGQGADTTLTLTGTNFARGATVGFGNSQMTTTGPVHYVSPTELQVPVHVASAAPTGSGQTVTVTNTGPSPNAGGCSCLTVDAGPAITSFSPAGLGQGAVTTLTIAGSGFDPKATVTFGPGMTADGTPTVTSTRITVPVEVAPNAPSSVPVTVQNPDFGKGDAALPISAGPSISAVTPRSVPTKFDGTLKVTGTGFADGATVSFPRGSGVTVPAGKSATVSASGAELTVPIAVSRRTKAAVDVTVTNSATDFGSATCAGCLQVVPPTRSALSIHHSARRILFDHRLTLHGVLTDASGSPISDKVVRVYRENDKGHVRRLRTVTTDGSGAWAVALHPRHNGNYYVRFAGNAEHLAVTSGKVRTGVEPRITIHAKRTTGASSPLVVTGSVAPNKRGHRVHLIAIDRRGHRHALGRKKLTKHSTYRFSVSLGHGTWRLQVRIGKTTGNVAWHSHKRRVTRT